MQSLQTYFLKDFFAYLIVLARLGGLFFFLPAFSELTIPSRVKILILFTFCLLLTPILSPSLPPLPPTSLGFGLMILGEVIVGYLVALTAKLFFAALDVAGSLMGYQIGIANAFVSSPASAQQSALPGVFLTLLAVVIVINLDFHHWMIRAFVDSYQQFSPGHFQDLLTLGDDFLSLMLRLVTASFALGLKLASPILVTGLFLFAASGLINRLVPQIQVFFVTQPVQILLGFGVLFLVLSPLLHYFAQSLFSTIENGPHL